jgi:hypothetical protein
MVPASRPDIKSQGASTSRFVFHPGKPHSKNGIPTGRKFGAGLAKSFPAGRKLRENSIDKASGLYVGSEVVVSCELAVSGPLATAIDDRETDDAGTEDLQVQSAPATMLMKVEVVRSLSGNLHENVIY